MSLAADLSAALPSLQVAAESLMVDACIIERPGEPVTDPETGVVSPSHTLVYEGRCKLQQTLAQSSSREAGGAVYTTQDTRLDIPVGVGPVRVGDWVTMVSGAHNPDIAGTRFRVMGPFEKSWQTAQRLRVEELT